MLVAEYWLWKYSNVDTLKTQVLSCATAASCYCESTVNLHDDYY